jgi:Arc/MetJ family transcription regulator
LTSISIDNTIFYIRTTLDLPEELIEEAHKLLGFKSKTDTVLVSLQELIRRKRIEHLKAMAGQIELEIDLPKSRGRQKSK